jgi:BirA family transcriptional regulator, biotin operon repressor / biotin---[acetyl-CoA-carboxylase] ligase
MKFDIRCHETTGSTNDDAKEAASKGATEGLVIWALQQSSGRGRQGRQWHSPEGNLYFSVLLRPSIPLRHFGYYSFLAALAISDALQPLMPQAKIELKWPNDVLVDAKKISGILLEAGEGWLVIGMGINVRHTPENPLYPVTSLLAEKADPKPLGVILQGVLQALSKRVEELDQKGFSAIRQAWLERAKKGEMRVRLPSQSEIEGQFVDLDKAGNLRLILKDGSEKIIRTGDVFF